MSFFQVYTQLIICKVNPKVVNKGLYDQFYMKEISCMECEGDCLVYRVHMDHGIFDLLNLCRSCSNNEVVVLQPLENCCRLIKKIYT